MKILLLVPDFTSSFGGIKVYLRFFSKAVMQLGHSLRIISMNDQQNLSISTHENLDPYESDPLTGSNPVRKIRFVESVISYILTTTPDLIICGHVNFSPFCRLIHRLFEIPYITIIYGVDIEHLSISRRKAITKSRTIVSISPTTARNLLSQLEGNENRTIFILPCTFDEQQFQPGKKPDRLMGKWNFAEKDKIILTVARLSRTDNYKGYDRVLQALKQILFRIPQTKYILVGDGDDTKRICSMVQELGLQKHVILTGFVPPAELPDYYNLCDVFVMPSTKEGFGIVFLEALACGKPVIAGNQDGSVDALLNGELGTLVVPHDVAQLRDSIIACLLNQDTTAVMSMRSKALKQYGFENFAGKVAQLLSSSC